MALTGEGADKPYSSQRWWGRETVYGCFMSVPNDHPGFAAEASAADRQSTMTASQPSFGHRFRPRPSSSDGRKRELGCEADRAEGASTAGRRRPTGGC